MKSTIKAMAIGLLAVTPLLVLSASASATTDDRFPEISGAPSWYLAAPGAPYASSNTTSSDQLSVQDEMEWYAGAWWFGPQGGAPDSSEPDIIVETFLREDWEVGATDPNLITLSLNAAFPALTDSLGTEFTKAVAIPDGNVSAAPALILPGDGIIIAQRPPRDCLVTNDVKDPSRFTVNLAMLGENQRKYLVNLTVEYGERTWNDACAGVVPVEAADKEQSTSEATAAPVENADEIKKAADAEVAEVETAADADDTNNNVGTLLGVVVLVAIGLAVIWVLMFWRKRTHNNDGTRIQKQGASRTDEPSDTSTVRSRHGSRW